jgi:hypothetical protein
VQDTAAPRGSPLDQPEKVEALKLGVKAANVPEWAQRNEESIWESGGTLGDGAEKQGMGCNMCAATAEGG